ncbi:Indole-3-acetaldehyde oxidase [Acorus calamus]|uniref:Indole-3-acetaldehyde oxidase n=1 Tax=Acorus calamus TaxID=4465 RepID=A0AAV9BXL0_ACOCL|nr:Indole-3-acetaldehyde oxidase [Acorus calamus]
MEEMKRRLIFAVNGERFELQSIDDPSKTLLEFLRSETPYKGPKLGCGEGGCGACVVLLARYDPATDQVEEHTVSSCMTLLCSINLCSVTTSEGLENSKDGFFHSIHQRFASFHASQCGFCTPGMCISIFSALTNADKSKKYNAPTGFSKLTVSEAEKAIAGNLCRCTGYRPIDDACKSFAVDVDMEDLGFNSFCRKGENGITSIKKLPVYNPTSVCTFAEFLKDKVRSNLDLSSKCSNDLVAPQLDATFKTHLPCSHDNCWYLPTSIKELYSLLSSEEANGKVGNTDVGVYRNYDQYDKYIDVRNIPELTEIKRDDTKIEIGAAVTISRTIEALKEGKRSLIYTKIGEHMSKVTSHFIRNMASLGVAHLEDFLEMPPINSHILLVKSDKVENFLVGKSLTASVLLEAIRILFDFLRPLTIDLEEANVAGNGLLNGGLNGYNKGLGDEVFKTEQLEQFDHLERSGSLLSAKQVVEFNGDHCPVGEPVKKVGAELQASGEAVFVDDIPSPKDCLYGAFIYSTKPSAHVKEPKGGENIGANFFSSEPLFAEDNTEYAGQPLGLVIAESQRVASMAANRAVIDYSTENMEPPNFTVEDAVRRSSYFQTPSSFSPKPVGHFSKGMEEADHKILSAGITLGSQYYFYMETQTALAVPDEDNCGDRMCTSSTQALASSLNVP